MVPKSSTRAATKAASVGQAQEPPAGERYLSTADHSSDRMSDGLARAFPEAGSSGAAENGTRRDPQSSDSNPEVVPSLSDQSAVIHQDSPPDSRISDESERSSQSLGLDSSNESMESSQYYDHSLPNGGQRPALPAYFHSRRMDPGEKTEKPWIGEKKDPRETWATIFPVFGAIVGIAIALLIIWDGYKTVPNYKHCLVYGDDFGAGLKPNVWTKEVEVGGFGNGQFEQTTNTDENVFVRNGVLVIKPTLQDHNLMTENNILNLTKQNLCTSAHSWNCVAATNVTNGTVINPAKSARINTKKGAWIKYGRVEVEAKMPSGDWLWPAIWMLPVKDRYGEWPASGEIDILESRGNNYSYPLGGNNVVSSALHWGPDPDHDRWWKNTNRHKSLLSSWTDEFHIFGLEWTEEYLRTYIDNRMMHVIYYKFDKPFWKKGRFPEADEVNNTRLIDPWSQTGSFSTPFDQDFYLILNVAVGGTNGWFEDGAAAKPWVDASPYAMRDFWDARHRWYPTWKTGGEMQVRSVKMWQKQGHNGCEGQAKKLRPRPVSQSSWKRLLLHTGAQ